MSVIRVLLSICCLMAALVAQEPVSVPTSQVVEGSLREYGERVVIRGLVRGDVWAAGSEVVVDGVILGDLYALAGSVVITGQVQGDVRLLGAQVSVNGLVGGHSRLLGAQVNLGPKGQLLGSCYIASGAVDLRGKIAGNTRLHVGNAELRGQFLGRLEATAGEIEIGPSAYLGQGLDYWSRRPLQMAPSAEVRGKITSRTGDQEQGVLPWITTWLGEPTVGFLKWIVELMNILYILIAGLFLLWLFPHDVQQAVTCLRHRPASSLGVGLVTLIVVPLISFLFLITVLGIPVALTILALNVFGLYTAKVVVICLLGAFLVPSRWRRKRVLTFCMGLIPYLGITSIPTVGPIVAILSMIWGLGAAVLSHRDFAEAKAG